MIYQLNVAGFRGLQIASLPIPGIVPHDPWTEDSLPIEVKVKVVRQVVQHFRELFSLRLEKAGSIYFASTTIHDHQTRETNAIILNLKSGLLFRLLSIATFMAS